MDPRRGWTQTDLWDQMFIVLNRSGGKCEVEIELKGFCAGTTRGGAQAGCFSGGESRLVTEGGCRSGGPRRAGGWEVRREVRTRWRPSGLVSAACSLKWAEWKTQNTHNHAQKLVLNLLLAEEHTNPQTKSNKTQTKVQMQKNPSPYSKKHQRSTTERQIEDRGQRQVS